MKRDNIMRVFFVMSIICVLATTVLADPNKPVKDPNKCFLSVWDSVTISAKTVNPKLYPEKDPNKPDFSLSLKAEMKVLDDSNLVAWSSSVPIVITDEQNRVIYQWPADGSQVRARLFRKPHKWPGRIIGGPARGISMSVGKTFPIDPNKGFPAMLNNVDGYVETIFSGKTVQVKMPFKKTDGWVVISPNVRVNVEQAEKYGAAGLQYRIKMEYAGPVKKLPVFLKEEEPLPEKLFAGIKILDAKGRDISVGSGALMCSGGGGYTCHSVNRPGEPEKTVCTFSGKQTCAGDKVKTVCFEWLADLYMAKIPFSFADIPVAGF